MTVRMPKSVELAEMVHMVVQDWAGMAAVHAGLPAPGPADLPVECSVRFTAPVPMLMVVRGNESLAQELAERSTGDPNARALFVDAFKEFANLLAEQWAIVDLRPLPSPWEATEAESSAPESWPDKEPAASSVVFVNALPLELRLWTL